MPEYLTVREAAVSLDMDEGSVRRAILGGRIDASKFGKAWLIRPTAVERFRRTQTGNRRGPRRKPPAPAVGEEDR